jgi:thiol-disulfide isomerase/thioredoxin
MLLLVDCKTIKDMQTVIAQYKKKLILLDFWASWCSPCRVEMPYLDRLKKNFKDKNIVFVCISTDKQTNDWLKASKEESLVNNNDFLFLNFHSSQFAQLYKINTIPRYILIDAKGKIINDDTPRPSDPKLKELINRNLR